MHFPHEDAIDRSFSVIYSSQFHSLDLICKTSEQRDMWVEDLEALNSQQEEGDKLRKTVEVAFTLADRNGNKSLDTKEVYQLLLTLNVMIPRKELKKMVQDSASAWLDIKRALLTSLRHRRQGRQRDARL